MNFKLKGLMPVLALCLALGSCKKNDAVAPSSQLSPGLTNTTNLIALGEDELNAETDESLNDDPEAKSVDGFDCAVVTFNPSRSVYPHTKTVDFGAGCSNGEGKTISGKRISTIYADWKTAAPGTLISVTTYSNYTLNGLSVGGSTKRTLVAKGNFKVTTTKTFKDNAGNKSTFIGTHNRKQIEGSATPTTEDDVYEITGSSTGTEKTLNNTTAIWRATIDANNVVVKSVNCSFRGKGGLKIKIQQIDGANNEYLDYGDGTCDNKATLSVNGGPAENITLPLVFYTAHL